MALDPVSKATIQRLAEAIDGYAATHGWARDDYHLFMKINQGWGQAHVLFVAKFYPDPDMSREWMNMMKGIEPHLPLIMQNLTSLDLTLRTFDQVSEGGIYSIGPGFEDVEELLDDRAATHRA